MTAVDGVRTTRLPSIAVVGAGAIGTVIADALSDNGDVTLCRRGTGEPMLIDEGAGARPVRARIVREPGAVHEVDWVVLATKAQQTSGAADWLDALVGPHTRLAVLQNGINHADRVSRWTPATRVVPAIVYISAQRTGPNLVQVHQVDELVLPDTPVAGDFAGLFAAGFPVRSDPTFERHAWRKLVMNAALNSVTTLTERSVGVAREVGGRDLIATVLTEGIAVAEARGVNFASDEMSVMQKKIEGLPGAAATSMQLDRVNGRPLEYQFLTGAVLKEAALVGIQTPTTKALHELLSALP